MKSAEVIVDEFLSYWRGFTIPPGALSKLLKNYADSRLEEAANLVCGLDHCDMNGHSCTTEIRDRIRALKSKPSGEDIRS